ncbi:hypothetical protein [Lentzea xinjiangensis]|nr:hypothetical protein [Lentzea xinjiangensis]
MVVPLGPFVRESRCSPDSVVIGFDHPADIAMDGKFAQGGIFGIGCM